VLEVLSRITGIAVHLTLLLLLPPLLSGLIVKIKAWFAGRRGPSVIQPYRDLARLWHKGAVYSEVTTQVFRLGPLLIVASSLVAGLFVPLAGIAAPLHFTGDLVVLAYVLALGRAATILAAMDTGSAFEGMGASREAAYSAMGEPTLFLVLVAIGMLGHTAPGTGGVEWSLTAALTELSPENWLIYGPALVPLGIALFVVILLENSRIPIDDPTTHLELTMIHEVMVLDHSGPDLALIEFGAFQKLLVLGSLLVEMLNFSSSRFTLLVRLPIYLLGLVLLAAAIALTEVAAARFRMRQVPRFLFGAFLLAAFSVIVVLFEVPR
jgi:formate hydrogenlyase subunit 4